MWPVIRLLLLSLFLAAAVYFGLYTMAVHFEPEQREVQKSLPGLQIER